MTRVPAQHLAGGWVLVHPSAVPVVRRALSAVEQVQRRDGISPSPEFLALASVLAEASEGLRPSVPGRSEVPRQRDLAASAASAKVVMADPVTAEQAAEILGCTSRNVRGLCAGEVFESAQRSRSGWEIERAEVVERAHLTNSAASDVRGRRRGAGWAAVDEQARRGANSRW